MSHGIDKRVNRRQVLRAGLACAGVVILGSCRSRPEPMTQEAPWAFLSDLHIPADPENNYRGFYPYRNLEKVLPQVASIGPKGVVVTGDLARLTGEVGDYENLKKLLAPVAEERPIYLALGNHDNRANFRSVFDKPVGDVQAVKDKHVTVVDAGCVRFLVLDSLMQTNLTAGLLGKAQRTWLESYLRSADDTPTILFVHHTFGDGDGDLLDAPRLLDLIKPMKKVKAIIYGHSHEYAFSRLDGIHLINLPATAYAFGNGQPVGWLEARLTRHGGEFILHAIAANTQIDGQTTRLHWR
ncbi:MAG: metallophosphoesterase [Sedimentisphaerales bacterium]|nr:metallophosphoesterase [Sedimentisphaerales bacterium]